MTRIKLEKGYNNPSANQKILVELEDGTITGAKFFPVWGSDLHESECFEPVGIELPCFFSSPVVAWFAGDYYD